MYICVEELNSKSKKYVLSSLPFKFTIIYSHMLTCNTREVLRIVSANVSATFLGLMGILTSSPVIHGQFLLNIQLSHFSTPHKQWKNIHSNLISWILLAKFLCIILAGCSYGTFLVQWNGCEMIGNIFECHLFSRYCDFVFEFYNSKRVLTV